MNYQLLCLDSGETVKSDDGCVRLFDTGAGAASAARALSQSTGKKHQPRPVKDDDWQVRESRRMRDGTYTHVPWDYPDSWWRVAMTDVTRLHFAHVSSKHPGCISYTADAEKGAADIQTSIKPGRYLTRFYGQRWSEESIRSLANEFVARFGKIELRFADTPASISEVYVNGPRSCMSGAAADYQLPVHPCSVYGAGDLAVAYLASEGDDDRQRITARAVCWPVKKIYTRLYGDAEKLRVMLESEGYQSGSIAGARLLRIEHNGNLICPYIDYQERIQDDGNFLIIGQGHLGCGNTNGLVYEPWACPHCDEAANEDASTYIVNEDESWCESCTDGDDMYRCRQCDNSRSDRDDSVEMSNGAIWCGDCFSDYGFRCEATDISYNSANHQSVTLADGTVWHGNHFAEHGFTCATCQENFDQSESAQSETRPGTHCTACAAQAETDNREVA